MKDHKKIILIKRKTWDLRGNDWDEVYCITEKVCKENWGGVKLKKEFESDLRPWGWG